MTHAPRRRDYQPVKGSGKGVGDASEGLRIWGGVVVGAGVGLLWGGAGLPGGPLLWSPVGGAVAFVVLRLWLGGWSRLIGSTLTPSGGSTAYRRQYSDAETHVARGAYTRAVSAYQQYVLEDPRDPEPYMQIARIYRERLEDYGQAAEWYRRARTESALEPGRVMFVAEQLAELYLHKLRQPRKAIPELAHLAEQHPDTPMGQAAARDLAHLRQLMAEERDGGGPMTERFYRKSE